MCTCNTCFKGFSYLLAYFDIVGWATGRASDLSVKYVGGADLTGAFYFPIVTTTASVISCSSKIRMFNNFWCWITNLVLKLAVEIMSVVVYCDGRCCC